MDREPVLLGSLCSGIDGLAMGIERTLGARTVWQAEIDPHASKVLAAHWSCPNLGDLTAVDWAAIEPVEIMCAGYPCQPFSHAGRRLGENDVRHLWPFVLDAVRVVRPRVVLLENVAGHLSLGFGRVLGDLAEVGYDCRWTCVRASDVGACHRRERVFIVATDADRINRRGRRTAGRVPPSAGPGDQTSAADADYGVLGLDSGGVAGTSTCGQRSDPRTGGRSTDRRRTSAPDTDGTRLEGCEPAEGRVVPAWGDYEPAIRRHEHALGRPAPDPVDGKRRLSPLFVEWMMMFPEGHVTDHLGRTKALKALGNAVLPAVAERACRLLLGEAVGPSGP